jgi:antitoxin component of MazEF toxin-antitoxin module
MLKKPAAYMPGDTQIAKWENSLAVRIAKALAGKARLAEGDRVSLDLTNDGAIVLRLKRRYSFVISFLRSQPKTGTQRRIGARRPAASRGSWRLRARVGDFVWFIFDP